MKWGVAAGSIIFSSNLNKNKIYPDKKLGLFALEKLKTNRVYLGQVGAGCSASYGQGAFFGTYNGIKIFCLVVLNAVGSLYNNGSKIADPHEVKLESGKNTTITVLVTDDDLRFNDLKQLARQCHTSMAENIKPFNTIYDGDTFYACSLKDSKKLPDDFNMYDFNLKCSEIVRTAILNYK
jgi:L-aminopeptidase/D-esterase-like protein